MGIYDELRRAIKDSPKSQQALSDEVGINLVSLNRFVHGHRGVSVETAEKLAAALGMKIEVKGKRKRKPK